MRPKDNKSETIETRGHKWDERWEEIRRRGRLFYVFVWGVCWGGLAFILSTCLDVFVFRRKLDRYEILISALTLFLFGCVFGLLNWRRFEGHLEGTEQKRDSINENEPE
jgi:hypothetical protein